MTCCNNNENTVLFNLWVDCPNSCDFCFVKFRRHSDKIAKLNETISIIESPDFDQYNVVGLIGGELFGKQSDQVQSLFIKLIDVLIAKIKTGKVKRVQISTAMLYKDCTLLYKTIDQFVDNDVLDSLLLCTSYDVKYRFKTPSSIQLWTDNFDQLNAKYPKIKTHVEIIVTNALLKAVESDQFNVDQFIDRFKTQVSFLEPRQFDINVSKQQVIERLPEFLPERNRFIEFASNLIKADYKQGPLTKQNLMSCNLFTDTFYTIDKDDNYVLVKGIHNKPSNLFNIDSATGRTFTKLGYCDSDIAMYDDLTILKKIL